MAYERLNLKKDDLLDESVFKRIDDGIEGIYNDLYSVKTTTTYTLEAQTVNIKTPSYSTVYSHSTFSGWGSYAGKPSKFDRIQFPVLVRSGYPISQFTVKVYEMPEADEMTFSGSTYTPRPNKWRCIASITSNLKQTLEYTGVYEIITVDFPQQIVNSNNKHLYIHVYTHSPITMGICTITVTDAPFNPDYHYTAGGNTNISTDTGGILNTSTSFKVIPVAFYSKEVSEGSLILDTEPGGTFHALVQESINNSETFSSVFSEKNNTYYAGVGSVNLFSEKRYYTQTLGSTFTGRCFPIGVIPSDIIMGGIALRISARAAATRIFVTLYEVDQYPEKGLALSFSDLNPIAVRSSTVAIDMAAKDVADIMCPWEEGNYQNTNGKKLMIGYNLNGYTNLTFYYTNGLTIPTSLKSIDGNTYSNMEAYYTTDTSAASKWQRAWDDNKADLWSAISVETVFDFGEGFYDTLNGILEESTMQSSPTSEIRLAKEYDLVVGDTFQLFYEGVIKSFAPLNDGIRCNCQVGYAYPRYFEFTPAESHANKTYTLTLSTRRLDGSVISTGSTKLNIHPKLTDDTTPDNLNIMMFGDSLTGSGVWCSEGLRRIYGATDSGAEGPVADGLVTHTVTSYGGYSKTNNTFKVYHEGHSGWTWGNFITTSSDSSTTSQIIVVLSEPHGYDLITVQKSEWTDNNGLLWELEEFPNEYSIKFNRGSGNTGKQSNITLPTSMSCSNLNLTITNPLDVNWSSSNPFYDELTGEVSLSAHAAKYNNPGADIFACLLTWNGASPAANFINSTAIDTHISNATTLINQIHSDYPNAKVICLGIQISDLNGGCGKSYGANGGYSDTWASAFYAFDYNKALEELLTQGDFANYCYYVDVKAQFDSRYNMPANYKAVNTRNTGVKELIGANGVHPYNGYDTKGAGYYQIGDAFYRALTKVIPIVKASQTTT